MKQTIFQRRNLESDAQSNAVHRKTWMMNCCFFDAMLRLWCILSVLARNILFLYLEAAQAMLLLCHQALWTKNFRFDHNLFHRMTASHEKLFFTFRMNNLIIYFMLYNYIIKIYWLLVNYDIVYLTYCRILQLST